MDISSPKFDDSSSLSNPDSFLVSHISLNWNVDFEKRKVFGSAKLTVLQKKSGANELHLDSRNLAIHRVFNATTGAALYFAIEPHSYCEPIGVRLNVKLPDSSAKEWMVVIEYSTNPDAQALTWLLPEKTVGMKFPYVFSHCQAIYARTLLPCQDTPFVKVTYDASVKVPKDLTALMSAIPVSSAEVDDGRTFRFEQKEPIPSYLIALAVGALESRDVGPRTRVWSEAEEVDAAASQFAETEKYIQEATTLMDFEEYVWRRCDLLILPPSVSYAGMENPCTVFVTPALLAGDRPLVDVIAQGISHYCTDNLYLSTSRKHFWRSQNNGGSLLMKKKRFTYAAISIRRAKRFRFAEHSYISCDSSSSTFRPPSYIIDGQAEVRRFLPVGDSLKQKVQDLPLLCVESICKFASTTNLVCLYSNAVPLPGAWWSHGLDAVLRKRLPLFLRDDRPFCQPGQSAPQALFDVAGAKVASIKHPEAFPYSPLCEFVETAVFTGRVASIDCPQLLVVNGQALSSLTELSDLTLLMRRDDYWVTASAKRSEASSRSLLEPNLKHLLPRLASLAFINLNFYPADILEQTIADFLRELPLREMAALQRLIMPEFAFTGVMAQLEAGNPVIKQGTQVVLARLASLSVWQRGERSKAASMDKAAMLRFLSTRCAQLSSLFLCVDGDFNKTYLAAFRTLTGLTTLGLYLVKISNGLSFNKDETICSVLDLRFICSFQDSNVFTIAKFFPNATAVAFQSTADDEDALNLASTFCSRRVLPALSTLSCYHLSSSTNALVRRFIANPDLPRSVDLSQVLLEGLIDKPGLLTAIYREMQANCSTSLLLRGPVHREALSRLQSHLDLNGDDAKVTAWKDRALGEQPGLCHVAERLSEETDIEIVGQKTWGSMAGETFTIRVFHQFSSRTLIFG